MASTKKPVYNMHKTVCSSNDCSMWEWGAFIECKSDKLKSEAVKISHSAW